MIIDGSRYNAVNDCQQCIHGASYKNATFDFDSLRRAINVNAYVDRSILKPNSEAIHNSEASKVTTFKEHDHDFIK
jgi:hypothetical protein